MQGRQVWAYIRGHAQVVFPLLAVAVSAVILTSPLYTWPFSWLSDIAFGRFCMFWVLSVFIVLAFVNQRFRPALVSILSGLVSLVVGAAFTAIYLSANPGSATETIPDIAMSFLSGAILGSLAGTWLIYVLEAYWS